LGVDEERGRWFGIPREQRRCVACGATSCGVRHFLSECTALPRKFPGDMWGLLFTSDSDPDSPVPGHVWRDLARGVAVRWRALQLRLSALLSNEQQLARAEALGGTSETSDAWEESDESDSSTQ